MVNKEYNAILKEVLAKHGFRHHYSESGRQMIPFGEKVIISHKLDRVWVERFLGIMPYIVRSHVGYIMSEARKYKPEKYDKRRSGLTYNGITFLVTSTPDLMVRDDLKIAKSQLENILNEPVRII